jgi:hypothetical protein
MSAGLLNEYEAMLNPGLGAEALASFTAAFEGVPDRPEQMVTLWHIATVLPLVFHEVSRRAISKRLVRSGLRSILTRNPEHDIAQNEAIFNLTRRMQNSYPRTIRCLNCAIGWRLLQVEDGGIVATTRRRSNTLRGEARDVVAAAQKLGTWAGQLSLFEYLTVLALEPQR